MRRWLWRLLVAIWTVALVLSTAFFALNSFPWFHGLRPIAYFAERDPRKCPGYGERETDDVLAGCIRTANSAQRDWVMTRTGLTHITAAAVPPLILLSPMGVLLAVRMVRRRSAPRPI